MNLPPPKRKFTGMSKTDKKAIGIEFFKKGKLEQAERRGERIRRRMNKLFSLFKKDVIEYKNNWAVIKIREDLIRYCPIHNEVEFRGKVFRKTPDELFIMVQEKIFHKVVAYHLFEGHQVLDKYQPKPDTRTVNVDQAVERLKKAWKLTT